MRERVEIESNPPFQIGFEFDRIERMPIFLAHHSNRKMDGNHLKHSSGSSGSSSANLRDLWPLWCIFCGMDIFTCSTYQMFSNPVKGKYKNDILNMLLKFRNDIGIALATAAAKRVIGVKILKRYGEHYIIFNHTNTNQSSSTLNSQSKCWNDLVENCIQKRMKQMAIPKKKRGKE